MSNDEITECVKSPRADPARTQWNEVEPGRSWPIVWRIPGGSVNGVIVQEIVKTNTMTGLSETYYEAWDVGTGGRTSNNAGTGGSIAHDDVFGDPDEVATVPYHIRATARYYPGQEMPEGFAVGNVPHTGNLPSNWNNPRLDESNASLPVTRTFTIYPRSYLEQD